MLVLLTSLLRLLLGGLDVEKAATKIQARQRGRAARLLVNADFILQPVEKGAVCELQY